MDNIGVLGTSYRSASVDDLAAAALPADFEDRNLVELASLAGFSEFVYVGTCNRVEFYFRGETRIHTKELLFHLRRSLADLTRGRSILPDDDRLYIYFGTAAVRHLFRVTSALDSMMVGEAQIAGQVKEAHERSHQLGLLGGVLDQTFHEAFHIAKRVRSETDLARRPVSMVTLVERTLHEHLATTTAPVLILGAGEMAGEVLRLIRTGDASRPVIIASRTEERAERLAESDPAIDSRQLDAVLAEPPESGLVVAVTAADATIVTLDHVRSLRERLAADQRLLIVDLAMPSNVDERAGSVPGVLLHGIERMRDEAETNRQLRLAEIDRCESMVEQQLLTLRRHLLDRALSPVARSLQRSFREMADRAIDHSLARELEHLSDDDRAAVRSLARGLVKRLVQVPLRGLKGAAWNHSSAVIAGFIKGLEPGPGPDREEPPS